MEAAFKLTHSELEAMLVRAASLGAEQYHRRAADPFRDLPLTKKQAADYLSVSVPTIDRWMNQGLPYEKPTPKAHPRFYKAKLDEWVTFTKDSVERR
jgi:excisionase family DNA binding protein